MYLCETFTQFLQYKQVLVFREECEIDNLTVILAKGIYKVVVCVMVKFGRHCGKFLSKLRIFLCFRFKF